MRRALKAKGLLILLLSIIETSCATLSYQGKLEIDDYWEPRLKMQYEHKELSGGALLGRELGRDPIAFLVDILSFRIIRDHKGYPCSGLVGTLLDALALVPGYTHTDTDHFELFGQSYTYYPKASQESIEHTIQSAPSTPYQPQPEPRKLYEPKISPPGSPCGPLGPPRPPMPPMRKW